MLFAFIIKESQKSRMNANQYNYPFTRKSLDFESNSTLHRQCADSIQYAHEYMNIKDGWGGCFLIYFHNWIDYNGVAFSIELLEWDRTFSGL